MSEPEDWVVADALTLLARLAQLGVELRELPEELRYDHLARQCRLIPGPCFCGCHVLSVMGATTSEGDP